MPDGYVCPNCGGELVELGPGPGEFGEASARRVCPGCGLKSEVAA